LKGATVKCYLDGQLIQDAVCKPTRPVFAAAGRGNKSAETIIALVNPGGAPFATRINLAGANSVAPDARVIALTSASPDDENSFDQPELIKPREERLRVAGPEFECTLPAWSFTLLRLGTH
jgi:alpha-N-arabinofuranosidase